MALTSTIYQFEISLSHVDRGVYEHLSLRVARHPSETEAYLWARVLAYCLEYREGIAFSPGGLSDPESPALVVRDLTGALQGMIEIGLPEAARLHKAAKAAPHVAVYMHKDPAPLLRRLEGERIHRAEGIELYELDRELLAGLTARLERRMAFDLSVSDGHLYLTLGDTSLQGPLIRHVLQG